RTKAVIGVGILMLAVEMIVGVPWFVSWPLAGMGLFLLAWGVMPARVSQAIAALPGGENVNIKLDEFGAWLEGAVAEKVYDPDFAIALEPGEYRITFLRAQHVDLANKQITLFIGHGGIRFTAPESGCSYIGRIFVNYYRLPPLDFSETLDLIKNLGEGILSNLKTGGIFSESAAIDRAPPDERPEGSENCNIKMAEMVEWE
ncbi:MAG: hypothetical protein IIC21_06855, partial [Chloroflexi bacterium]|nr:hypothetical protein [Chloroflexota bacterium]